MMKEELNNLVSGVEFESLTIVIGDYRLCRKGSMHFFSSVSTGEKYTLDESIPIANELRGLIVGLDSERTFRDMIQSAIQSLKWSIE